MTSRTLRMVAFCMCGLISTVAMGCEGCQGAFPDPPVADCSFPDPVVRAVDPCEDGAFLVRGLHVVRSAGRPDEASVPFEVPAEGRLCVSVRSRHVSSARIEIDGEPVFAPSDFNPHVGFLSRRRDAGPGPAELDVRLASRPGAELIIDVRFAPSEPDPRQVEAAQDFATLQRAFCEEFNAQAGFFDDPADLDAFVEGLIKTGIVPGRISVMYSAWERPSYLGPLAAEDLGLPAGAGGAERASAWLVRHQALMGIDPAATFVLGNVAVDGAGNSRVFLDERIGALPVFGAGLVIDVDAAGQVRRVQGNVVPDGGVAVEPVVSADEAVAIALEAAELDAATALPIAPVLGVLDESVKRGAPRAHLAWRVELTHAAVAFVDALEGRLLELSTESALLRVQVEEITTDTPGDVGGGDGLIVRLTDRPGGVATPPCDSRCVEIGLWLGQVNRFYSVVWGRDGWSHGRGPHDGEYRVHFNYIPDISSTVS